MDPPSTRGAKAKATALKLPLPGEDVTVSKDLWPTPAPGLFGLDMDILMARQNTMCAMLQEMRVGIAALQSRTEKEDTSAPKPKKKRHPAQPEAKSTAELAAASRAAVIKLANDNGIALDDTSCTKLLRSSRSWAGESSANELYTAGGNGRNVNSMSTTWAQGMQAEFPGILQLYQSLYRLKR